MRPGLAQHGKAQPRNWSRIWEADNIFVSAPNELQSCKKDLQIFLNVFPKSFRVEISKAYSESYIPVTSYKRYYIGILHNSFFIKCDYL